MNKAINYFLLLLLLVILSYGQITSFTPWEDDNALFFKLNHLQESAGFLGSGIFGAGPYRYTAAFYLPVFQLFNNFYPAFYIYSLFFYFLATAVVYFTFSKIINKSGGLVAGFLYGCGYIASDGFIRLFNSVPTSISIISICLFLLFLWKYFQKNMILYLGLALLFFTTSLEFTPSRTHYLIGIVFIFEIIFFNIKAFPKQIIFSLIRLALFSLIFYKYFLESADSRSGNVMSLIQEVIHGRLWNLQSFFVTLANLTIPSWLINTSLGLQTELILVSNLAVPWLKVLALAVGLIFCLVLLQTQRINCRTALLSATTLFIWSFVLNSFFYNPNIQTSEETLLKLFLGGETMILLGVLSQAVTYYQRRLYILLLSWISINILAYTAYDPTGSLPQISRYLAHSFFPLVGLMALIFTSFWRKSTSGILISLAILAWGINNLVSSVFYQSDFKQNRILPIKNFYHQLSNYTPYLSPGTILYFDISENSSSYFFDATTSSQMPDTTAIALRYGLDRDDIKLFRDFDGLTNYLTENPSSINNTHTYFYNNQELFDTTESVKQTFNSNSHPAPYTHKPINQSPSTLPITFNFPDAIPSYSPLLLTITASAYPMDRNLPEQFISLNNQLVTQAFDYQKQKTGIINKAKLSAASEWRKNRVNNLVDGDQDTYWQPNRILFGAGQEALIMEFQETVEISGLAWINRYLDNAPKNIFLSLSADGQNWQVMNNNSFNEETNQKLTLLSFPIQKAKHFKIAIPTSLNREAPAIAEMWLLKDNFSISDITHLENVLADPFLLVSDKESFSEILSLLSFKGNIGFYWKNNKSSDWQTNLSSKIKFIYDGQGHTYQVAIPAGGTKLTDIKLDSPIIPGTIKVSELSIVPVRYTIPIAD